MCDNVDSTVGGWLPAFWRLAFGRLSVGWDVFITVHITASKSRLARRYSEGFCLQYDEITPALPLKRERRTISAATYLTSSPQYKPYQ